MHHAVHGLSLHSMLSHTRHCCHQSVNPAVMGVAASAVFNSNSRIMVAALKFFLGQDEAADNESDDDDDDDFKAVQPSKAEVYKANSKVCN